MAINKENKQGVNYRDNGLSRRFISYLIDWYVGGLATSFPIALISQKLTGTMLNQDIVNFEKPFSIIAGVLALAGAFIYFIIVPLYIRRGQTLGKRICKIKIVQSNGDEVSFKNIILRQLVGIIIVEGSLVTASSIWHQIAMIITGINFVTPLMYVGFIFVGISIILVMFKKDRRAIHDYIGNTKVVMCE